MISSISNGEHRQRRLPAEIVDHRHAERREQELPERSGRGSGAEREAALLGRQQLAERRQHQVERTSRQSEADQHAGADIERQRRRGIAHQEQAGGIEQRADAHHAQDAEPVGDRARDRLAQPHNRFCSASARPNTSRPQANSRLIGCTKKPRLERGPKLNSAIAHPQMMITSGVRQLPGRRTDEIAGQLPPYFLLIDRRPEPPGQMLR